MTATIHIYPNIIPQLGGATLARVGKRITAVQIGGRVYKVPTNEASMYINDGIKLADFAKKYTASVPPAEMQ